MEKTERTDQDVLMFFDRHQSALPIYEVFRDKLYLKYPETQMRVQKLLFRINMCLPVSHWHG